VSDANPIASPLEVTEADCPRCCSTNSSPAQGFTLLEVLVAFVIAALALSVLFDAGLTGLRSALAASRYEQAIARARSRLAMATHANPLAAGDWQGDDGGGFTWHVRVTPIATATVMPIYTPLSRMSANFGVTLYAVVVWVAWGDDSEHEVRLDTEQIGTAGR
jgi:general secretion pathway protein I